MTQGEFEERDGRGEGFVRSIVGHRPSTCSPADGAWADAMLFEAGLRAARVIVQAAGYRIDAGKGADAATIDAADVLTGERRHAVFTRLQRMRRRRNDFMYDTAPDPSQTDLRQAQRDVTIVIAVADRALEAPA